MKKKILIFSGTHPRHLYVNSAFLNFENFEIKIIVMRRESLMPSSKNIKNLDDKKNFIKHFTTRSKKEKMLYGDLDYRDVYKGKNFIVCSPKNLNSKKTYNIIKKFKPDLSFIFGVDIIKDPILRFIKKKNINLHLGLSPWYKGSATLFWPFYFLQPHYAGATFHRITENFDEGPILHQTLSKLRVGQGIHDVANNVIISSKKDLIKILKKFEKNIKFNFKLQKKYGRIFYTNTFKPHHLKIIYSLFKDKIVDYHLKYGSKRKLKLVKFV